MMGAHEAKVFQYKPRECASMALVLSFLGLTMCSCDSGDDKTTGKFDAGIAVNNTVADDPSTAIFEKEHLVDVQVEMAAEDWAMLKKEARSLPRAESSIYTQCDPEVFDYTYFVGKVTIDGELTENVGIRKKGFLGSLSLTRPSLKINFGKFDEERRVFGIKRMTLNNDRSDPSHVHQCMTYEIFRQAGGVVPRCNFARVTVNGEDLGIYTHVESIKKPFLARHFESDEGNLYEAAVSDFQEVDLKRFEVKTNEEENDKSDLQALVAALQVSDDVLYEELNKVVDVDAFLSFWAMEVLTGHWDGLSGDNNNFYMYNDPATKRFYFIPWGTDGAFSATHNFFSDELVPASVYAYNTLTYRLYNNLATRRLYHERLRKLVSELWNVEDLLQEVDRIGSLTSAEPGALEEARQFIRTRGENIMSELVGDGPDWVIEPLGERPECRLPKEVSGSFVGTWNGDYKTPTLPTSASLNLILDGAPFEPSGGYFLLTGLSEPEDPMTLPNTRMIGILGMGQEKNLIVMLEIAPSQYAAGEIPFHGFENMGWVFWTTGPEAEPEKIGTIGDGVLTLTEAGQNPGDPISGTFSGMYFEMPQE